MSSVINELSNIMKKIEALKAIKGPYNSQKPFNATLAHIKSYLNCQNALLKLFGFIMALSLFQSHLILKNGIKK
jgi:hypothetical protein